MPIATDNKNGNGKMDERECLGDYAFVFALSEGEEREAVKLMANRMAKR
jgi:hypothetical protein